LWAIKVKLLIVLCPVRIACPVVLKTREKRGKRGKPWQELVKHGSLPMNCGCLAPAGQVLTSRQTAACQFAQTYFIGQARKVYINILASNSWLQNKKRLSNWAKQSN